MVFIRDSELVDYSRVSPDVKQYTLELRDGEFVGKPGQHTVIGGVGVQFVFGDKNTDQLLYKSVLGQYEMLYDVQSKYVLSRESWS